MTAGRRDEADPERRWRERWYDLLDRGRQPRLVRALLRYVVGWGGLHAGGVTFTALLSLTAALTIVVNVTRALLASRPRLFSRVIDLIDEVLPGIIDNGTNQGIIRPDQLVRDGAWGWTTVLSTVVIVWSSLVMMTGLRRTVRQMFGLGGAPLRFVRGKLIDLMGFALLAVTVLASSLLVSGFTLVGETLSEWVGLQDRVSGVLLAVASVLLVAALDAVTVWLLIRVVSKVRVPRRDLLQGMALGAVGFGLLRLGGTALIGAWSATPLLAAFAAVGTLLLWVNLALRWLLFTAAWTANPPAAHVPVHPDTVHAREVPNYVTLSAPHTLGWRHHQVTGALIPDPDSRFERGERPRPGDVP